MRKLLFIVLILPLLFSDCKKQDAQPDVQYRKDVDPNMLYDGTFHIASQLGSEPSVKKQVIKLPVNTLYWVYWIGVGQEPAQNMQNAVNNISKAGQAITTNPVIAFGLEILSSLPALQGSDNIDFYITDYDNAQKFMAGDSFNYFNLTDGIQTSCEYRKIDIKDTPKTSDGSLYFCYYNNYIYTGVDVTLKVYAFVKK